MAKKQPVKQGTAFDNLGETPEERIQAMLQRLRVTGFIVAKEIAKQRGLTSGTMECPMCHGSLRFSIASCNGHMAAMCETENCIKWIE